MILVRTSLASLVALAAVALAGCTSGSAGPSTAAEAPASSTPPTAGAGAYPMTFPVLDEAELGRRTEAAEKRSPGWKVALDPFGFLSRASCTEACGHTIRTKLGGSQKLSQVDRDQAEDFLAKNDDIVHAKAPNVVKKYDNGSRIFYQQLGPGGVQGWFDVSVDAVGVNVGGHAWPAVAAAGATKPDAELEALVKKLDPTPELLVERSYRWTATSPQGPLEIHEAACAVIAADQINKDHPRRPCVDARTGTDLSPNLAGMEIKIENGKVVSRKLTTH